MTLLPSASHSGLLELLKEAGELLAGDDHEAALRLHARIFVQSPDFAGRLGFNFCLARRRYRQTRRDGAQSAAVCTVKPGNRSDALARILVLRAAEGDNRAGTAPAGDPGILVLDGDRDILAAVFDFALQNPRDEIHLTCDGFVNLVCGLCYRLLWDAEICLPPDASLAGPDMAGLQDRIARLARDGNGQLDRSLHAIKALDQTFTGLLPALRGPAGEADRSGALLDDRAGQVFALLGGWDALRLAALDEAPARDAGTSPAAQVRAARNEVLAVEREILGFLRKDAAPDSEGRDRKRLDQAISRSVRVIKEKLACAHDGIAVLASRPPAGSDAGFPDRIDELAFLYPQTPYYRRLRQVAADCTDAAALARIAETLERVDIQRQGQVPHLGGPLVSVVMPAFNRERLIPDAIASVLAQSHGNFELLVCDDASTDRTAHAVKAFKDKRIRLIRQEERKGAAAARNRCLDAARGEVIAYLDSDNLWHPRYLEIALEELAKWPGQLAAYAGFIDIQIRRNGKVVLRGAECRRFHLEDQIEKPFVDLNSFVHSRRLFTVLGGFDERLARRQDYDLISRYCWSREPVFIPYLLNLYQRLDDEEQITHSQRGNLEAPALIQSKIDGYYAQGLPASLPPWLKKVSVLSWDMSRNHFAKAFCVADALSRHVEVELISFRFFEEGVFQPLADVKPDFETKYFEGGDFPGFFDNFARGVDAVTGDAIYAVKPRLTSFGIGLLANYHSGKPLMLECNDLETVVGSAKAQDAHASRSLDAVFDAMDRAVVPHDVIWSQVLDPLVTQIPVTFTHNINLNIHYRNRSLYMRNIKDDRLYDPARHDRDDIRRSLGFKPDDRVILFGGLVRKHKGIFELIELLDRLNDPRCKLLVVGSRETPDLRKVSAQHRDSVVILPPQPPERMAAINLAADLVVLWFDPNIPAGHYQSPYKMSDALAMGPSIIASPTSDLADFARRGLVWNVPFGDLDGLAAKIREIFADPGERLRRQKRARAFFQREFSYKSVLPAFALGASGLERDRIYPAAERFADFFAEFKKRAQEPGR